MQQQLADLLRKIVTGEQVNRDQYRVLIDENADVYDILYGANLLRQRHSGDRVDFCSIINARSGACSEDCAFCVQSSHHGAEVEVYPLVDAEKTKSVCADAEKSGAVRFGIVTSGPAPTDEDVDEIASCVRSTVAEGGIPVCVSLGRLSREQLRKLAAAGVRRIHCNLETSEKFFPEVCSTHTWREKYDTIKLAGEEGLEVCSGGILGMGENWEDRLELALALKELGVDSVPLNFLVPREGTPLAGRETLRPLEALRIIALFRYVLPDRDIRVCGGREATLRSLQSWMFYAGASGALLGNYLTTSGNPFEEDLQMTKDLGLKIVK